MEQGAVAVDGVEEVEGKTAAAEEEAGGVQSDGGEEAVVGDLAGDGGRGEDGDAACVWAGVDNAGGGMAAVIAGVVGGEDGGGEDVDAGDGGAGEAVVDLKVDVFA